MPDTSTNPTRLRAPHGASIDNNAALSIGNLLADMNDEIRSSVIGVVGMLDLLCDAGLTDAQLDYARKARSGSHALLALIERLSDLSLIAAGRIRLAPGPFDLRREAEAAAAGKREAAQAKGLRFSATLPSQLPALNGDAARIRSMMSCLIDTVIHFAGQGEVSATITAESEQAGLCHVCLEVKAGGLDEASRKLLDALRQPGALDASMLRLHGRKALDPALGAALAGLLGAHVDVATDNQNITTLRCSFALPIAAHPAPSIRALLIAERSSEWTSLLSSFIDHGIGVDAIASAMDGLVALKRAADEGNRYGVVMIGSRVQGMDATILSAAIKGDGAGCEAMLILLSERDAENEAALAQAGFAAVIDRSATPASVQRVLARIREAPANGASESLVFTTEAVSPPATTRTGIATAKRRVLIADDNPVNREVAARMLEKFGFDCAHAADGREAAEMQRNQPFDLILMDCEMPRMDGYEATALIRSQERASAHTPVIALTASTSQGEREKCLASGMDDFLSKPIRPQLLSDILARWAPVDAPASPSAPSSENPLSDELDAVQAMFGADFAELAYLYQRDTPPRIATLHSAFADGDSQLVTKVAHALGGSSASIGATGLSVLCREIETRAKAGALDGFEQTMASIENEYRRISNKLQSLIG